MSLETDVDGLFERSDKRFHDFWRRIIDVSIGESRISELQSSGEEQETPKTLQETALQCGSVLLQGMQALSPGQEQ